MKYFFYLLPILLGGFLLADWLRDEFSSAQREEGALRQEDHATALSEFKPFADYEQGDLTGKFPEWKEAIGAAVMLYRNDRFAEAKNAAEEALLMARNEGGENHLEVATILKILGRISVAMEDYALAERHYESALAIVEERQGEDVSGDVQKGNILFNLAQLRYLTDRLDESEDLAARSLSEYRTSSNDTTESEALALDLLAGIYWVKGSSAQAMLLARHSAEILERELGPEHSNVQALKRDLARGKKVKSDEYLSILAGAASEGHEEVVRILLDKGVDLNSILTEDGETALMLASWYGRNKTVGLLLASGADPELAASGKGSMEGMTALFAASVHGHVDVAEALLGSGANPNKPVGENTVMMMAALRGHRDMVELLLRHDADIEAANDTGMTPLLIAASKGRDDVVKLLLEAGAEPNRKSQGGRTAVDMAEEYGHAETAALISDFGKSVQD